MSPDDWYRHLAERSGPLAPDRIASLQSTPELVEALHNAVGFRWNAPDVDDIEDSDMARLASLVIGLLRIEGASAELIALQRQLHEQRDDWTSEVLPYVFAAIGSSCYAPLEQAYLSAQATAISDEDSLPWMYALSMTTVVRANRELLPRYLEFVRSRLAIEELGANRHGEWLSELIDLSSNEARTIAEEFFDRHPSFHHEIFGDRNMYFELVDGETTSLGGIDIEKLSSMLIEEYEGYDQWIHERNTAPASPLPDLIELIDEYSRIAALPLKSGPKIGRNEPCPCGSGKKYKKCHGA